MNLIEQYETLIEEKKWDKAIPVIKEFFKVDYEKNKQ